METYLDRYYYELECLELESMDLTEKEINQDGIE